MKKLITIAILTALSGIAVASAHDSEPEHEGPCGGRGGIHRLEDMDANKDGRVTRDEMLTRATEHFDQADVNHDGTLTPEERKQAFLKHAEERFAKHDKNKSGALEGDELPPHLARFAARLDANHDGKLTREELRALGQKHEKHFAARFGADKPRTRSDLVTHSGERFNKLDANHDGVLTQDEMPKGHRPHSGRDPSEHDEG